MERDPQAVKHTHIFVSLSQVLSFLQENSEKVIYSTSVVSIRQEQGKKICL